MKKLILTTLMSVAAAAAFAQGTVNFLNDSVTLTSPPDRLIRFGAGTATPGLPAVGTNVQVQLYYGASTAPEGSLVAVSSLPARLRASTTTFPGVWTGGGFRTLTGFDFGSGSVNLQVRVWDIAFGATYEEALLNPNNIGLIGKSQVFQFLIPASSGAPPGDFVIKNFSTFDINPVPEPSSFALAGLGAAALLIFRRRK